MKKDDPLYVEGLRAVDEMFPTHKPLAPKKKPSLRLWSKEEFRSRKEKLRSRMEEATNHSDVYTSAEVRFQMLLARKEADRHGVVDRVRAYEPNIEWMPGEKFIAVNGMKLPAGVICDEKFWQQLQKQVAPPVPKPPAPTRAPGPGRMSMQEDDLSGGKVVMAMFGVVLAIVFTSFAVGNVERFFNKIERIDESRSYVEHRIELMNQRLSEVHENNVHVMRAMQQQIDQQAEEIIHARHRRSK